MASSVVSRLGANDVALSAGSACHTGRCGSGGGEHYLSDVLKAMGVKEDQGALGTIRISTGRHTTLEEVELATRRIAEVVREEKAKERKIVR